jgi:hypothetical protein
MLSLGDKEDIPEGWADPTEGGLSLLLEVGKEKSQYLVCTVLREFEYPPAEELLENLVEGDAYSKRVEEVASEAL